MRSIVLSDDSGTSGTLDPLWFPGGNQLHREGRTGFLASHTSMLLGDCGAAAGAAAGASV